MAGSTIAHAIRPYRAEDEPAVLALLQRTLAGGPTGRRDVAFFRWKHHDNPFGSSVALVAEADAGVVGFRTFMRWQFTSGQDVIGAVRAVDTATHPEYQGQGIFSRLTRACLELLRGDAALVFNTPNTQSLPGYLKLGWTTVGTVPVAIRPVRVVRFLRHVRRATRGASTPVAGSALPTAAEVLADAEQVDALLADAGVDGRLTTARSSRYLRWRYAQAPGLDYRCVPATAGGRLAGLAIGRLRSRGPLSEFTLTEVLVRSGDRGTATRLLRAVTAAGCDHVATHLTPGTVLPNAGLRAGYLALPGRGLTLTTNSLAAVRPDPAQAASWRLSLGDLEVF